MGAKNRSTQGCRVPDGEGTDATALRKLHGGSLSSQQLGADSTSAPSSNQQLALRSRGGIRTGGCGSGGVERGTARGSLEYGAPPSTSTWIAVLADHREALRDMSAAVEAIILKLHIEDRTELALALCKAGYVLKGGAL